MSTGARPPAPASGSAAAAPFRDDSPPAWLPPLDYAEIAWPKASALIRSRSVDRVIATQTRRAYLVSRTGDKHFTIEPRRGDLKRVVAEAEAETGPLLYREWDEISWQEAEAHVRTNRVTFVTIGHFQMVTLSVEGTNGYLVIVPKGIDVLQVFRAADPSGFGLAVE